MVDENQKETTKAEGLLGEKLIIGNRTPPLHQPTAPHISQQSTFFWTEV